MVVHCHVRSLPRADGFVFVIYPICSWSVRPGAQERSGRPGSGVAGHGAPPPPAMARPAPAPRGPHSRARRGAPVSQPGGGGSRGRCLAGAAHVRAGASSPTLADRRSVLSGNRVLLSSRLSANSSPSGPVPLTACALRA